MSQAMAYYILQYEVVEDYAARRMPYRDEHLRRVREAHARGELPLAGALGDPPDGALLLFQADTPSVAERFANTDPYVINGCVTNWRVRLWNVVVGR